MTNVLMVCNCIAIVFKWQLAMYMYMYIFYILAFLKFVLIARKEFNKYHFGGTQQKIL